MILGSSLSALLAGIMVLGQGSVRIVELPVAGPCSASAYGHSLPVFDEGGRTYALLYAELDRAPGNYILSAKCGDAVTLYPMRIEKGAFKTVKMRRVYEPILIPPQELSGLEAERNPMLASLKLSAKERLWKAPFRAPLAERVSENFGVTRIYSNHISIHRGLDLRAATGDRVRAISDGKVLWASGPTLYLEGNMVALDHGEGIVSIYLHLSSVSVKIGDLVRAGQELGRAGATGNAYGSHLHLGLRINNSYIDPLSVFRAFEGLR